MKIQNNYEIINNPPGYCAVKCPRKRITVFTITSKLAKQIYSLLKKPKVRAEISSTERKIIPMPSEVELAGSDSVSQKSRHLFKKHKIKPEISLVEGKITPIPTTRQQTPSPTYGLENVEAIKSHFYLEV